MAGEQITREDLEAELRATVGGADGPMAQRRSSVVIVAVVVGVVVVASAWILGRRAGRHRSTVVEVRRI